MVEIGQRSPSETDARPVAFTPPARRSSFECLTRAQLQRRMGRAMPTDLEQIQFDLVIAPHAGPAMHEVDFEPVELDRQRWLHIRPGQVHRWSSDYFDADLFLLPPRPTSPHWQPGPRILPMTDDALHDVTPLIQLIQHERRAPVDDNTLALLRDLIVTWLDLDNAESGHEPLYAEFRRQVDADVHRSRSVTHYAQALNCSTRTLARACQRAGAPGPKTVIDETAVRSAQRMLGLPGSTVTATAFALGFDEVTNFTKFFTRVAGKSPSAWQAAQHPPERK